jgi:hypothetical protein
LLTSPPDRATQGAEQVNFNRSRRLLTSSTTHGIHKAKPAGYGTAYRAKNRERIMAAASSLK